MGMSMDPTFIFIVVVERRLQRRGRETMEWKENGKRFSVKETP
jgi:hypothetical protein